jgi:hypothetical protein
MAAVDRQLSGVEHPFWEGLPYTDICKVICNDVLHGLHKAFRDHTAKWNINIIGVQEIDTCFQHLPKMHGHRHFTSGISKISQLLGHEWKDLEKSFLPVISGAAHPDAVKATQAELDFIYTAQWKNITDSDLGRLKE